MTEQRAWLSPAEQEAWRSLIMMNHLLDDALDRQLQRDAGMPHAYYTVLVFLYEAPGQSMSMSALAAMLRYSPSRLAHAIKSMEKSGWVARSTSAEDRRVQIASLTPEGLSTIRRVAPLQVAEVRTRVLSRLSPEQLAQLTAISAAVLEGLEGPPAPA